MTNPDFEKLMTYAEKHEGFFTAHQASAAGYSPQNQSYYVRAGRWERHARGIFRIKHFRKYWTDRPDFVVAYLWTQNADGVPEGVISHSSALLAWNLSSLCQYSKIDLTVPKTFRRRSQCVYKVQLHQGELNEACVEDKFGVRLTNRLRTVLDLILANKGPKLHIESKHIREAVEAMVMRGFLDVADLKAATLTDTEKELLLSVVRKINYHPSFETRVQSIISTLMPKVTSQADEV